MNVTNRPVSIRRRVTIALAALLAVGLSVADLVTYLSLREFLSERLDAQLASGRAPIERYLGDLRRTPTLGALGNFSNPSLYIFLFHVRVSQNGILPNLGECHSGATPLEVVCPSGSGASPDPAPALPATLHFSHRISGRLYDPRIADANLSSFEVGAVGHAGFRYRVQAVPVPAGGALVVAAPLAPMNKTLANLLHVEIAVSLAALGVLVVVVVGIVRAGLRPLEDMAAQADAIAAGELSRRVEPSDQVTEAGRLGAALNSMLSQIESAFSEREASEARLRRFLADVSHELRTPLTSIRGYAELFRRGASARPADLARAMSRIESEAARMSCLVDDLMLLARLDQGRELERAPVDLLSVAADAVADAGMLDPEREVSVEADGSVIVMGDEGRLRQLVANLVTNALRHTPAGTAVKVSVGHSDGTAEVAVWDGGPAIDPEILPSLFERFRTGRTLQGDQCENGTDDVSATPEGSGLGLSIVRAIATAHGGSAWVTSSAGEGTTFHVTLPLGLRHSGELSQSRQHQGAP